MILRTTNNEYPILITLIFTALDTATAIIFYIYSISMSVFLSYLFVYKLFKIYKLTDPDSNIDPESYMNNNILSTITRSTILALISLFFSICAGLAVSFIFDTISEGNQSPAQTFIASMLLLIDIYSNYCCMMLQYSSNNSHYALLCGYCDKKGKVYIYSMISKSNLDLHIEQQNTNQ